MKYKWSEKKVSLSSAVIGGAVTLVLGVVIGLNWTNIINAWGPYLGFGRKANVSIDLSSVNSLYQEVVNYYDGEINQADLIEGAKKGLVSALGDKYTMYLNAEEAIEYKKSLNGETDIAGVGVEMAVRENYVKVIRTLPDNPARRAGVLAGDIIYAVDGEEVWDKEIDVISGRLRGEPGSSVKLTVVREGDKLDFELTREILNNVSADIAIKDKTAVISVYRFAEDTGKLVESFDEQIKSSGATSIVLDLRNNGGGYVSAARDLLSLWLDGEKVLTQQDKNGARTDTYALRSKAIWKDMKTVVLVNGSSASASEIVAGALQDYGKATVVGETTYGKGVVQQMVNQFDGSILKVTTAHWYTPNNRTINGEGIKPDVEVERTYEEINAGRDPQMDKALKLVL